MNELLMVISLGLLGAVFGSFAGAQVWRLRANQLKEDKAAGEKYDKAEYARLKPLMARKQAKDRSVCLNCKKQLHWVDLVPVVSWLALKGRCRYCQQPIGKLEITLELIMPALFIASFYFWPFGFSGIDSFILLATWLAAVILMVMLAVYDCKWRLLPNKLNFALMAVGAVFVAVNYVLHPQIVSPVSVLASVGLLSGLYAILYVVSKGSWIGFGDVKLGVGLGLLLGDWRLAFFALFMANLIGCILVLPGLVNRKLTSKSHISFGPMLIAGTLISFWWGLPFVEWLFFQRIFFM